MACLEPPRTRKVVRLTLPRRQSARTRQSPSRSLHTTFVCFAGGSFSGPSFFQKGNPLFPEGVAVFKRRHVFALFPEGVCAAAAENTTILFQEGAAALEYFFQKVEQMRYSARLTRWRLLRLLGNPTVLRAILHTRPGLK